MPLPLFATASATRTATRGGGATKKRAHVAVCPFFQSPHPETFFLLGHRIATANRDVQVTVFVPGFYGMYLYWFWNPEEDHNLVFYPVGKDPWGTPPPPHEQLQAYLEEIGGDLRRSMARAEEEYGPKITYVVADAFLAEVCRGIADERGIHWSAVWTSSDVSLAAYLHGEQTRLKSGVSLPSRPVTRPIIVNPGVPVPLPEELNRSSKVSGVHQPVDKFIPGFPPGITLLDLPHGSITDPKDFDIYIFGKMFQGMVHNLPSADVVIVDSFGHGHNAPLLRPKYQLGGLFSLTLPFPPTVEIEDPEGIFPWLDSAPAGSVVYINLLGIGAVEESALPTEREVHALAEALDATGVRFVWYLFPAWPRVVLPEGFEERAASTGRGKVVRWSYSPVRLMKMERGVVRHKAVGAQMRPGAWWSVSETLVAGKPIIFKPANLQVYDQSLNMALVERVWGIGVNLENWALTKASAEKALRTVMLEEEGRRMKEKAAKLAKLAEEAAHGGSAQNLNNLIARASQ